MTASMPPRVPSAAQKREIAKQAYVYGFPMVDFYRILYGYFLEPSSPTYAAPFNQLYNTARVYTPADTTVQTPNSDTPYSFVGLDLRAETIVITLPAIEKGRYYSAQFVDLYTFNTAYAGTRTTGNDGGTFLIAGPRWQDKAPPGISGVIRFETELGLALIRTQLFGPSDLGSVKKIQSGYRAQPLSEYARTPRLIAPEVNWPAPLTAEQERTSTRFFDLLAFVLGYCPIDPSEVELRKSFSGIGVAGGAPFEPGTDVSDYAAGMAAGQQEIDAAREEMKTSKGLFGTRDSMRNNYLNRALGAQAGILGNTAEEAIYLGYADDSACSPLIGSKRYTLRFAGDDLPPVNAFWSLTMYGLPKQLLVENPIDRYLINSPMLPSLKRDADGGLTIYIQHESPGGENEANWLPAPEGPFMMVLRMYYPKASASEWKQPPLVSG